MSTFSIFDVKVYAVIDPGLTHSYICTTLALDKKLLVESTKIEVKVTNLLGQYVLVNKVCKNCPLKIQDCNVPADLMLLPFDVILGIDWLTMHDVVVTCKRKHILLKCQNDDVVRVE